MIQFYSPGYSCQRFCLVSHMSSNGNGVSLSRVNSPNPRSPRIHALDMISMGMYGVDQDEGKECIVIPPRGLLHLPRGCGPHVRTSSHAVITLYFRVALVKYKGNMIGNLGSTRQSAMSSQRGALGGQCAVQARREENQMSDITTIPAGRLHMHPERCPDVIHKSCSDCIFLGHI